VEAFRYSVFGSSLYSNLSIPGLPVSTSALNLPEIHVHLGLSPYPKLHAEPVLCSEKLSYVTSYTDNSGEPALRVWDVAQGAYRRLAYSDGTQFWLDRKASNIWAVWQEQSSLENVFSYLLGPILGLALRLQGTICLHASAVAFADRCVAFVGPEGAGKSTTAAGFARLGCGILSDDIVGLVEREGRFCVLPAYPHLCLWPESVEMLYGSRDSLPRLVHDWEKRQLALGNDANRFEDRTLPLEAIYLLEARRSAPAPKLIAVAAPEALLSLVANTYATNLIDRDLRSEEFAVLSRLVCSVPVRRIQPSNDPRRLDDLCHAIRDDFEALRRGAPNGNTSSRAVV
jgi:hypothetical protein